MNEAYSTETITVPRNYMGVDMAIDVVAGTDFYMYTTNSTIPMPDGMALMSMSHPREDKYKKIIKKIKARRAERREQAANEVVFNTLLNLTMKKAWERSFPPMYMMDEMLRPGTRVREWADTTLKRATA